MDEMDRMLARLGARAAHPGLAGMENDVLRSIAIERRREARLPMRLGFAATFTALAIGMTGGGASMALAEPAPATVSLGSADSLAPSTLLATVE